MEIHPDEVAARRFSVALRGYDRDEVARYLQDVAGAMRSLRARLDDAEARAARHRAGEDIANERLAALERETARHAAHEAELSAELAAERRRELSIDLTDAGDLRRELHDARQEVDELRTRLAALDPRGVVATPLGPPPEIAAVLGGEHASGNGADRRPADPPPFSFESARTLEHGDG
ncbi:DivIVA domain-containing protein [Actinomarinicola tropica]|uniref:DivIVA domain-containing protein n=1 Tax=Actinomarinicola tropica TaxID=2789776 RepID=UPI0018993DA6|nr:DivIVA domain-containing protein [Actinomarinicola tropica]